MLGLVASSASFATNDGSNKPVATTSLIGNEKVKLIVAPAHATGRITLQDDQGHILYSSNVDLSDGIKQQFDISKLERGLYQLSVAVGKERTVTSFSVTQVPSQQVVTLQN